MPLLFPPAMIAAAPHYAVITLDQKDPKTDAVQWLDKALEADKGNDGANSFSGLLVSALVYSRTGNLPATRNALTKAQGIAEEKQFPDLVHVMAEAGQYDMALAYAKEKGIDNGWVLSDIADYQVASKDPGAKATLLLTLEKSAAIDDLVERNALQHDTIESLLKIGAKEEAKAALITAKAGLGKVDDIFRGVSVMERLIANGRLSRLAGNPTQDRATLAEVEAKTVNSPYVPANIGTVLYELSVEYRALGEVSKADALCRKAAPMIAKIEGDGDEPQIYVRALCKQALAGQVTAAVTRAKKEEYKVAPVDALTEIGTALGEAGDTTQARIAFAAARTANEAEPILGKRLIALLDIAPAMVKAGDRPGAIAVFQEIIKAIPQVKEDGVKPALWALTVKRYASVDLPTALSLAGNVEPKFQKELFFSFAQAASRAASEGKKP